MLSFCRRIKSTTIVRVKRRGVTSQLRELTCMLPNTFNITHHGSLGAVDTGKKWSREWVATDLMVLAQHIFQLSSLSSARYKYGTVGYGDLAWKVR